MNRLIDWHRQHYPAMEAQDVVKLVFQAMLGCGHLLGDESLVAQRIENETAALVPNAQEALTEPLGKDHVRLNLRKAMAEGIPALWIARLMKLSPISQFSRQDVFNTLANLGDDGITTVAQRLVTEPAWLPSHTPAYHAAYAPAYRVISTQCASILPALCAIAKKQEKQRLLICIDGPCGSGKTTCGKLLQQTIDAALIPMDDFFLPHAKKTTERLAQPGGNADWERLVDEVMLPWSKHQAIAYRPYDCHADGLAAPIDVPERKVTIIEGSYSLLPAIRQHADLSIFLTISPELQQARIRQRNGEDMLQMFIQRWIPLERAYHEAYALPDEHCLILAQDQQSI